MNTKQIDRKNVLVTGGAGFIGSHLCDRLVLQANVICVDNFITSTEKNIDHLLQNPNFEFINHDIVKPLDFSKFPELDRFKVRFQGVQEIYHLACPISKRHFDDFKIATALTNSIGVKNVLDLAVEHNAKVLFASSGVLYGRRADHAPVKETDDCRLDHLNSRGAYDEGKRFAEALMETFGEVYGLDVKIARIFRTYGPRMKIHDGNLIPDMMLAALDNETIILQGDEEARITLCYVSDIVDGLIRLLAMPIDVNLLNLGSDFEVRLVSLAQKIAEITNSSSHIRFEKPDAYQFEAPLPDISRAKDILGWTPLVRLEEGLKKMIDYMRSQRQQIG
ncbi:NAD-dependent epimerase/dehydratase family protein [Patescibacteria group bacterium]|nr:NAD-dependent epimerase/dehydratase family protein [Patescibacteria group bacterium]MBU1034831.1 NAD-dependent epimerase/dehydratase family protein [Patescibacteria group bacterium]MBU1629889.1 NAD-dependent epimerase/dehydratase family protein [Patescibacteria group bacterium]MBU1907730.1 NAD-dependent epimerase/dehydratase family protein [Patescibacteria group bacterium]